MVPQKFLSRDHLELYPLLSSRPGRMSAGYICQSNVGVFLQPGSGQKATRLSLGILRVIGGAASEASLLRAACWVRLVDTHLCLGLEL